MDGFKDGNETDTDCGGPTCDASGQTCALGKDCDVGADCTASAASCNGPLYTPATTCDVGTGKCSATQVDCSTTSQFCLVSVGCVNCINDGDCPPSANECVVSSCDQGTHTCTTTDLGPSHALSTGQTSGDCQKIVCNGAGGTESVDDFTDLPAPNSVCEINPSCEGTPAAPHFDPAPTGTNCTSDNNPPNHVCGDTSNGLIAGTCVQCNDDGDCLAIQDAGTLTCDTSTGVCQ